MPSRDASQTAVISGRRWIAANTFELTIQRPKSFDFIPGQRLRLIHAAGARDYSLASGADESTLVLCIRLVDQGRGNVSGFLGTCDIPTEIPIKGPYGYFTFKASTRRAIFVATGTGIAPFCSMAASGIRGFFLLHGVRQSDDLYYRDLLQAAATTYIACISNFDQESKTFFHGRVTDYLEKHLPRGSYEFYLCGRRNMIRDVTRLVDRRFPDSLVYTEMFY
jgi:ferredoxin-NADP reductase